MNTNKEKKRIVKEWEKRKENNPKSSCQLPHRYPSSESNPKFQGLDSILHQ
jgi:hypothetical protein